MSWFEDKSGALYHEIDVYEITKGKIPKVSKYYVKQHTDEVYGFNSGKFIKITEGEFADSYETWTPGELEIAVQSISKKNTEIHSLCISKYPQEINSKEYVLYADKDENYIYAVMGSTRDLYEFNKSSRKLELIFKNKLNDEKVTIAVSEDVNGDGKEENIKLDYYNRALTVNDMTIAAGSTSVKNKLAIVDINKKDLLKEMVIKQRGYSDYDEVIFYYFDGKTFVGKHCINGSDFFVDGSGKFTTTNKRSQTFFTWSHDVEYNLTENYGFQEVSKEMYPLSIKLKVKHELQLQKSKTDKEIATTLKVGEEVELIGCDDKTWCCIRTSSGVIGWFEVQGQHIKVLNLHSADVFDGLFFAS